MAISSKGETATLKLPSNIEDGVRGFKHRQILILDLQLQVWSLEAQTSTIPLYRRHSWAMSMSGFSTETVNLNTTSGATAIIAESQRSRLLYFSVLVETSSWACHNAVPCGLAHALSCELKDFAIVYTKENVCQSTCGSIK